MSGIVAFVLNDARFDSRVQREAATLAAAGHHVTLVGRTTDPYAAAPERDVLASGVAILRVPVASGGLRWLLLARRPARFARAGADLARRQPARFAAAVAASLILAVPVLVLALPLGFGAVIVRSLPPAARAWHGLAWELSWRFAVLPWANAAATIARDAAPAARLFWAHDLRALPAAIAARALAGGGRIVYDAHEIFAEAGANASRPGWARRRIEELERELARQAAALVTVNAALAARLGPALGLGRVVVARNCPPRWTPSSPDPDAPESPLRAAAGVPVGAPILLYHGGLAPGRGIEVLAAALSQPGLETAHLVFMGAGPSRPLVAEISAASGGRVHLLPPVPPDSLLTWVSGADVVVAPIQPTTLNHRLSSPNKVFEGIAAGVPVVGSDLPGIREVLLADPDAPLGVVADPDDVRATARAIRSILDLEPAVRADLRSRCRKAARERWNWETEAAGLVQLARDLDIPDSADDPDAEVVAAPVVVRQAVCFVLASTGEFDARTLRMAGGLAGRGHVVTIVARAGPGLPLVDAPLAGVRLHRVDVGPSIGTSTRLLGPLRVLAEARRIAAVIGQVRRHRTATADLGVRADVVHAMGFLALPVAADLARRIGARLVYDARDLYVESNNIARLPRPLRAWFAWYEGRLARAADRVFTVNESCADYLERRYRVARPVVVMNGQLPWTPLDPGRQALHERLGLSPDRRIVLYHGGFMRDRGLLRVIEAIERPGLELADVVFMGAGPEADRLRDRADASPARQRIHILPSVPPEALLDWVSSADVGIMVNQPSTLNERFSTPNKLFECLTAGTPIVSSDFPERRRILIDGPGGPLGRVCDPTDPGAIAAALVALLALPSDTWLELRERCRRAGRDRYGWAAQFDRARSAYGSITGRPW
ncbi:MAG: glycosyltransferase [Chloroflexota bacterium]